MSLIGLDIGTSGCKAILFDQSGHIVSQATREYPILTPQPGWAEQDAEAVWAAAWDALREAISQCGSDLPRAMALSVQGEAVIPVDRSGMALGPAILGMDTRTSDQNDWLANRFGAESLYARTGMPLHTINTLPKLLWMQQHQPDLWRSAHRFLLYEDYCLHKLCGQAGISHCLASRTQMYDLEAGAWAQPILDACQIDAQRLATLSPEDGGQIGWLREELCSELGVRQLALVSGGHDQACAALGSGVISPGQAMVSTGTAEVVEVAMSVPHLTDTLREGNVSVYRHTVPGLYLGMTLNHSGGLSLRWFRDTFCPAERDAALARGEEPYDVILADCTEGATDLLLMPHFAGSGTPWLDTESKAALIGLSYASTRADVAKAILEGLTYELRVNLDMLQEGGASIETLHAVGGGARSSLWLRLKADICNIPLRVPSVTEAACLGAALLAGLGIGAYASPEEAVAETVAWRQRIEPDPSGVAAYADRYALYRELYPALKSVLHRM